MNVSLFTVRHFFVEFVEGVESEIRNPEFATLFLLLFVENHLTFIIFFGMFFFLNSKILSRKSQKSS